MRKMVLALLLISALTLAGCGGRWGSAGLGAAGGAAATAGGYEYHLKKELKRVENDFKDGKIEQREYEIRKDQIKRDSVF